VSRTQPGQTTMPVRPFIRFPAALTPWDGPSPARARLTRPGRILGPLHGRVTRRRVRRPALSTAPPPPPLPPGPDPPASTPHVDLSIRRSIAVGTWGRARWSRGRRWWRSTGPRCRSPRGSGPRSTGSGT
jgi:hypothetical protein